MGGLQPQGQMYQQQVHQAMQQGGTSHPAFQGQQLFPDHPPFTDSSGASAGSMACLYQNYQVPGSCGASWQCFRNVLSPL